MKKGQVSLVFVFITIIVVNILFWNLSYTKDVKDSYDLGFQQGKGEGGTTGYQTGYVEGNKTGYTLGYSSGNSSGYASGYLKGVKDGAGTGYNIRDPTYQEMLTFLVSDKTDGHAYSESDYNCYDFTNDVANNAFNAGYRCGSVFIEFADSAHAIVCFETTDKGLKFVEPQDDKIVTLSIGQKYFDRTLYQVDFDDTIMRFKIIW